MAISEQERRRRAAAAERARQERERLRLEDKRRSDELEAKRLGVQEQEQTRLSAEQKSREEDADRRRAREDFENSAGGQTYQTAKTVVPPALGLYVGHRQAAGIEARQAGMAARGQASMSAGRRYAPYAARSMLFLPEGYYLRNSVAPTIASETGRDLTSAAGTGMMLAGGGLLGEGAVKALTPQDRGGPRLPAPPTPPAPAAPAAAAAAPATPSPTGPRPHADRLISAARAAGAKGPLTKATAASYLETNLNPENRAAAAAELGIKPGRNFASRISTAVRNMANTRGVSSVLLPVAAGAMAYDAASSEAEAAGATPAEATGRGALAGGAAAGTTYGISKLAPYAMDAISKTPLGRVAARALPPAAAALTAYDIGNMAAEENARPDTMLHGPEEGTMPATPGNPQFMARQQALARQTRGGDDFDAQLAAFIQAVEEHNAGAGEPYGP